jgi:hypothetical protein
MAQHQILKVLLEATQYLAQLPLLEVVVVLVLTLLLMEQMAALVAVVV